MKPWRRRGQLLTAGFEQQEAAVLRGLVGQTGSMLRERAEQTPQDELADITGIKPGPTAAPDDPVLSRLLPDFHRLDDGSSKQDHNSAAVLRSLHEPAVVEHKLSVADVVLETLAPGGGEVRLSEEQADAWLSAVNDIRLALGVALDVTEDLPDELPDDDPRSMQLGVYHWLTYLQETLVTAMSA